MKRILALVLALCLLQCNVISFAEELVELNWDDVLQIEKLYKKDMVSQGRFVTFDEVNYKMWIPNVMKDTKSTYDDEDGTLIGYYETKDQKLVTSINYVDVGVNLADYKKEVEKLDETENVNYILVNGTKAISYDLPDSDCACLAFEVEDGMILEFVFYPASDDDHIDDFAYMGASIMPVEKSTEKSSKTKSNSKADLKSRLANGKNSGKKTTSKSSGKKAS